MTSYINNNLINAMTMVFSSWINFAELLERELILIP